MGGLVMVMVMVMRKMLGAGELKLELELDCGKMEEERRRKGACEITTYTLGLASTNQPLYSSRTTMSPATSGRTFRWYIV